MGPTIELLGVDTPLLSPSTVPLVGVVAAALLYLRACSVLAERGRIVPTGQRVSYFAGLALLLIATQTFIDPVGEQSLMSLHMLQHLLIADLPAPLLLYGVRAPVLYFYWPRPVLVTVARMRWLRALWAWLRRPPVAITTWLLVLYAWHLPAMYELSLTNRLAHDLQHVSFVLASVLAWWPIMDPTHHRLEGRIWKVTYVVGARMLGGVLGILLIAWPDQLYPTYGLEPLRYGIDPLVDQQIAGGMMMILDSLVVIVAATWLLLTIDRGAERVSDLDDPAVAAAIARAKAAEQVDEPAAR